MADPVRDLNTAMEALARSHPQLWKVSACGVTAALNSIPALLDRDAYVPETSRARVLLVSGLSGRGEDVALARQALELFAGKGDALSNRVALSAVPCGSPDRLGGETGDAVGDASTGYPPDGNFYYDAENPERRYLWRWMCFQAPDLLLELRIGEDTAWEANAAAQRLATPLNASNMREEDSLLAALGTGIPDDLGPIPGLRLTVSLDNLAAQADRLWEIVTQTWVWSASPARRALEARRSRSPLEVARILASAYGHTLDPIVYTQGVAISGRLRLSQLDPEYPDPAGDIASLVEDYSSRGVEQVVGAQAGSSTLAGLVWGHELGQATGDPRYSKLLLDAANRFRAGGPGEAPPPSSPDFRVEDMFCNSAVLGRAYRISGESRYLDLMTPLLVDSGTQQDNGLFWHCRNAPFFWSRGNGFAALGFAEALTYLPEGHPHRTAILDMHVKHLDALSRYQQPSGMFLELVDFPGSFQEFTATCQVGYAVARGLRRGWLDASHRPMLNLAWQGVSERIDDAGNVVDACISTGVQESARDYLHRQAVFGFDDRSGSMALWFAVELERLRRDGV